MHFGLGGGVGRGRVDSAVGASNGASPTTRAGCESWASRFFGRHSASSFRGYLAGCLRRAIVRYEPFDAPVRRFLARRLAAYDAGIE